MTSVPATLEKMSCRSSGNAAMDDAVTYEQAPTARRVTRRPKTVCPAVEKFICPGDGCNNSHLRSDRRCNYAFKRTLWDATGPLASNGLPLLNSLRETSDGTAWLLSFPYSKSTLADLNALIPAADRCYHADRREWRVNKAHTIALESLFADFPDWAIALLGHRASQDTDTTTREISPPTKPLSSD